MQEINHSTGTQKRTGPAQSPKKFRPATSLL